MTVELVWSLRADLEAKARETLEAAREAAVAADLRTADIALRHVTRALEKLEGRFGLEAVRFATPMLTEIARGLRAVPRSIR